MYCIREYFVIIRQVQLHRRPALTLTMILLLLVDKDPGICVWPLWCSADRYFPWRKLNHTPSAYDGGSITETMASNKVAPGGGPVLPRQSENHLSAHDCASPIGNGRQAFRPRFELNPCCEAAESWRHGQKPSLWSSMGAQIFSGVRLVVDGRRLFPRGRAGWLDRAPYPYSVHTRNGLRGTY